MVKEAAELIGVSHWTLRKYIKNDKEGWQPSKLANFGNVTIYIYTDEDVARIRDLRLRKLDDYRPVGRPSQYTAEQMKARHRLYARKTYWKRALEKAELQNDISKIDKAIGMIEKLDEALREYARIAETQGENK